jgi:hypothetical protein
MLRILSAGFIVALAASPAAAAQTPNPLAAEIDTRVDQALPSIVEWRRDLHQYPELGNREFRTAKVIAGHLERLGLEVQTGVAHTGVVGVLKGGLPGPVVALRSDMDGLLDFLFGEAGRPAGARWDSAPPAPRLGLRPEASLGLGTPRLAQTRRSAARWGSPLPWLAAAARESQRAPEVRVPARAERPESQRTK